MTRNIVNCLDTNGSDKGKSTYTVDEAIENIGFGKFQAFISVAIGSAWTAGKWLYEFIQQ